MTTRGPAIWATVLAFALVNVGIAMLIVEGIGARTFAPGWVGIVLLVAGVAAAVGAVVLWRQHLTASRQR